MGLETLNPPQQQISSSPNNQPPNPNRSRRARHSRKNKIADSKSPNTHNLVTGKVKILKRGEELTGTTTDQFSAAVDEGNQKHADSDSTNHSVQIAPFYSGSSSFIVSPPPSSLPLPAFFTKKSVALSNIAATSDLRRILRLLLDQS